MSNNGINTWAAIAQSVLRFVTGWTVWGSKPGEGEVFAPIQTAPGAHPASYITGIGFLSLV